MSSNERRALNAAPVLIVDDDPDVLEALESFVSSEGYAVLAARNGKEALALLERRQLPCLILLDMMMPDVDGWQFRKLQLADRRLANIPVVVITAGETAPYDAAAVVLKPISSEKLRRALKLAVFD